MSKFRELFKDSINIDPEEEICEQVDVLSLVVGDRLQYKGGLEVEVVEIMTGDLRVRIIANGMVVFLPSALVTKELTMMPKKKKKKRGFFSRR